MNTGLGPFKGTWDEFFEIFRQDRLMHGNIFEVNLSWWRLREDPRVLVLKYEDIRKDLTAAVSEIASHLEKSLSDELVAKIAKRTSFQSMRTNPKVNYSHSAIMKHGVSPFMRKGQVGDWLDYFSQEQSDYVDAMCEKYFAPENLSFKYSL